jgi:hypothetical protein
LSNRNAFSQNVKLRYEFFSEDNATAKVRAFPARRNECSHFTLGPLDSAALAAATIAVCFAGHFAPKQMYQAFPILTEIVLNRNIYQPKTMACVNAIAAD